MKYNTLLIFIIFAALIPITCISTDSDQLGLYDLDNNLVSFDDYKGKYSIIAFTFTSCPSICPMTNTELNRLNEKYDDAINIISINVDPVNDTIERINNYMNENNFQWEVLKGDMSEVEKVIGDILYYPNPANYVVSSANHPPGLHLMDKDFVYTEKNYYPISQDVDDLMLELDKLLLQ